MQTSPEGVAEIAGHEGIVLAPYRDSRGVWTFGIGHTKGAGAPDPEAMPRGKRQPIEAALQLFRKDIVHFERRVSEAVKVPLAQHEFDALVSFDFNTGGIFRARLTKLLNQGDRDAAADAFDGWHRPPEIIPRRDREKRLFRDGIYAHGGLATVYSADANGRVDRDGGTRVNVLALFAGASGGLARPPDDPGADARETEPSVDRMGLAGAAAAGLAAVAAFVAELAPWTVALAAIIGIGILVWRYRTAIGRVFGGLIGRAT